MQVAELDGAFAWCEGRGRRERLNTMLLEELSPGDWVYATLGHAREILTPQRANEINLALDGLAAALQGETNLDSYFPSASTALIFPKEEFSTVGASPSTKLRTGLLAIAVCVSPASWLLQSAHGLLEYLV
jgi:hydrogenase expression/formation protein HypC